jgi:hypothetical protein
MIIYGGIRRVVMNHKQDASSSRELAPARLLRRAERSYYAEVKAAQLEEQSGIIDGLIGLAFETLGARHLDLRVVDAQRSSCGTA